MKRLFSKEDRENKEKKASSYAKAKTFLENMENSMMSESSLKKDWLSPEEDKAWQDL
ncbi:MAG: hypothetical protein R6U96_19340 [Promethearchaeia archaeon]